jgi:hypothetical protein
MEKKLILLFLSFYSFFCLQADVRIVFYLKHAPTQALKSSAATLAKEDGLNLLENLGQKTPSEMSKKLLQNEIKKYLTPKLNGFIALYSGYMDYSNDDGLISFPLRHVAQKLYVVVTPQINLVKIKGETFSHKEFSVINGAPTKIYLFEKKEEVTKKESLGEEPDASPEMMEGEPTMEQAPMEERKPMAEVETGTTPGKPKKYYWTVTEQEIPTTKRVNPFSLVLLTNPRNIYIATGDFIADDSKHLVLPDAYVIGTIDKEKMLFHTMDIKKYFEPIDEQEQENAEKMLDQIMIQNM